MLFEIEHPLEFNQNTNRGAQDYWITNMKSKH